MESTSLTYVGIDLIQEDPNPYERLAQVDPHIKTRYVERDPKHGPKGGQEQRLAKRRAANKVARKARRN